MNKNIIHGTMALLFVLVVCISSAAAVDDTVTRDIPANVDAGALVTVTLMVDVATSATYYLIDEVVPSGWTVTSATDDGDYTAETGHVKWVVISGAADKVYSYTVAVPADASGACTFSGEYMFEGETATTPILGVGIVTIGLVDTVTRDLPANVDAGASITVDLTVDVETSATYYLIDEVVPSGWTVTSATDDGDYTAETGHVKWVVISGAADKVYSYTVTVPADASGAYTFSGVYMFENTTLSGGETEIAILGNDIITVTEEGTPTLTWQTEPPTSVMQGSSVTFDVSFSATAEYYSRVEDSTGGVVWRYPASGIGTTADPHPRTWTTTSATPGDYTIVININGDNNADTKTVTVTAAALQNIVAIGDVTLEHGATTDVPIQLVDSTGVGGATVTLTFNPSIVNTTNIVAGDFDGVFTPDHSDVSTGTLRISCTKLGTDLTGDLTIATVTLDAVGTSGSCALGLSADLTERSGTPVTSALSDGTFTISVAEDTTPPVITAVTNTAPTASAVTITWTTDEASSSIVKYGTVSGTYTESESSATLVTSHSITLTGLNSETTYYFVVNSTDANGNPSQSTEHSITTVVDVVKINIWTLPATVTRGTSIDATVNIENMGTEATWFVVSVAGTSTAGTSIVGLGTIELDAGETQVVNVKIPVPGDSGAAGTYTLYPDVYTFDGYPDVDTIQATGSGDTIVIS